ncbi:Uu.00g039200.m01.CDS01 [Anthostomella pinea]|uniref:Uu.00g039200.m01.CDS01 n=1 Tax=Anthostomella pinea TaxID=933095 RepID=A0AAI8VAG3_9PEZI|nr:Uu.00g039200.m01.CDS01 [Anthostomella pinea]
MARHGRPEEEMFLNKPSGDGDSPTVEPLRIFKPQSPDPYADKGSDRFRYPTPPVSKPSFPLPPGASSSAAPLPYPDDDDLRIGQSFQSSRPPYASGGRQPSSGSSYTSPTSPIHSARLNDTNPRLDTSPIEKRGPSLAERRGTAPKPLPGALSPTSPTLDDGGLFARPLANQQKPAGGSNTSFPDYHQKPYYPPPRGNSAGSSLSSKSNARPQPNEDSYLKMPADSGLNRFGSTASTSTTRASRGSPPPPETPIVEPGNVPGGGIEARYAAAGISGTATLNSLQSSAATQRLAQYGQHPASQPASQPTRPWTPTETPEQTPHGPPTIYQGGNVVTSPTASTFSPQATRPPNLSSNSNSNSAGGPALQVSVLDQDFQRMQMSPSPPPAYSSIQGSGSSSAYPNEKQRPSQSSSSSAAAPVAQTVSAPKKTSEIAAGLASPALQHPGHPAFANDPRQESQPNGQQPQIVTHTPSPFQGGQGPSSPPPLPEGWIAHLDQNSGQYYYIHLASQATQWEFPKGPNPIHHDIAPLSPTASTYGNPLGSPMFGKQSAMASPMFPPQTPGYAESIMSVATATPTTAGFSGPPPGPGVDMYKVQPTNGVYFGPYLRYVNMDIEQGHWLGSILIVTDAQQPPTIHIHQSMDLSPNPRQLNAHSIYTHQRWQFFKYDVSLPMAEGTERWTYAVTSHLGCTRYEFVIAGRNEINWRFVAHSGNDFAASTSQNERTKLGGLGFMWKDVLQKNVDCGGFHVQLGLGDQIYGDRLWKEVPLLKQWLAMPGRDNRKNAPWTARHEEDVTHAYFHFYTSHFDQPFLREAFAQIPHVCQIDDHDIFDGYGSYPEYMQTSQMFKNIGRIAVDMYLLFQHHTTLEILRNVSHDLDLFTITGQGWHFVKFLGPAVVVVGADLRSERTQNRVLAGPTYQGLFPKVAMLPPSVQHCIWMLSVPLIYPRLDTVETLANTFATGKKAVNTTYNVLGKVTSSVAGIVGGKDVVAQGFNQVKKAVGKSGLMGNVVNQFGDLDIGEILKDMWTHDTKDLERTYLIRTLQGIAHQKGIRMTFLSGDVNAAGAGLVHDPSHPSDHKTMYQVITSPIVAAPAAHYILKMLHNNKAHYVPANGQRSSAALSSGGDAAAISDTKEDMMEIFHTDASGHPRELKKLMGRRNYVTVVAYDPEAIPGTQYAANATTQGLSRLSLAIDFVVQGDGAFTTPTKYGPVIVPHLEFGR